MSPNSKTTPTWSALFLIVVAACTARGIDGPGASTDGGSFRDFSSTNDFASSTVDFASGVDLTTGGAGGCTAILICATECNGTSSCTNACLAMGTIQARDQFNAIIDCGYAACTSGGVPCMSTSDQSMSCFNCVEQAAQSSSCSLQLNACLND
jgi:hypothetical protein